MNNNILILSAGRRVSLVRAFQEAVSELNGQMKVVTADMNPSRSAACNISDLSVQLPHCLDANYIECLLDVCQEQEIKMVVPTIDTELKVLAKNKNFFASKGVTLVVSDYELINICRDKTLTNTYFEKIGIEVPKTLPVNDLTFPCFAKPISGSLSQDIRTLTSQLELDAWNIDKSKMMFMELVDTSVYNEFTIDIYYNAVGELSCIVPRQRLEVRGGEVSKALTDKSIIPLIKSAMEKVQGAFGCLTLQVFKHHSNNTVLGIEINPRFGGGFPLSHLAGAQYPKWLIQEIILNQEIEYFDGWKNKLMMLRYDAEVLVEPN